MPPIHYVLLFPAIYNYLAVAHGTHMQPSRCDALGSWGSQMPQGQPAAASYLDTALQVKHSPQVQPKTTFEFCRPFSSASPFSTLLALICTSRLHRVLLARLPSEIDGFLNKNPDTPPMHAIRNPRTAVIHMIHLARPTIPVDARVRRGLGRGIPHF